MNYVNGAESQKQYEAWKADWTPPANPPRAIGDRVIVEFSPYVTTSNLCVPEAASYQAIVVHDSYGELPAGQEVMMLALDGIEFTHSGRRLTVVKYSDIMGIIE